MVKPHKPAFVLAFLLLVLVYEAGARVECFYLKVNRDGKTLDLRKEDETGKTLIRVRFGCNEDPARIAEKIRPTGIFGKRLWVYFHCMWGNNALFRQTTRSYVEEIVDNGGENILLSVIWPANQPGYKRNWKKAHLKGQRLSQFFRCINRQQQAGVSILSHSMGNRVFQGLWQKAGDELHFEHVVLAAPDLDTDIFDTDFTNLAEHTGQIVLVRHDHDRMLLASTLVHGRRRLGRAQRVNSLPANMVVVNATPHASLRGVELSNHLHFIFAPAVRSQLQGLVR